jgi:hypothetical protein
MTHTRWLALLLVGVCPLLVAESARAQGRRSAPARTYVDLPPAGDFQDILKGKVQTERSRLEFERYRKAIEWFSKLDPKTLESVRRLAEKDPGGLEPFRKAALPFQIDQKKLQDPKVQKELSKLVPKGPNDVLQSPEGRKALEQVLNKGPDVQPGGDRKGPSGEHLDPPDPFRPAPDAPGLRAPAAGQGAAQPEHLPGEAFKAKEVELWAKLAHWLENSRLGERAIKSSKVQQGIRELEDLIVAGDGWGKLGGSLQLKDLNFPLPSLDRFGPRDLSLPSLPRPNVSVTVSHLEFGGGPLPSGLSGEGGGLAALQGLLWGALALLAVLLLRQLVRRGAARGGPGPEGWRLGPWPVEPARVGTWAELVQAFEHLALLRLGQTARAWNHREIAAGLGGEDPARGRAAAELARLYEQARYSPDAGPLSPPDLNSARRNLCLLAGVATA